MSIVTTACTRMSELVEEARNNYPAINDRLMIQGFCGSEVEASLIRAYIETLNPADALTFDVWRQLRKNSRVRTSPSGVDLHHDPHYIVVTRTGGIEVH